jgi:hypothetical protein
MSDQFGALRGSAAQRKLGGRAARRGSRVITCPRCHRERWHYCSGHCAACYDDLRRCQRCHREPSPFGARQGRGDSRIPYQRQRGLTPVDRYEGLPYALVVLRQGDTSIEGCYATQERAEARARLLLAGGLECDGLRVDDVRTVRRGEVIRA